MNPVMRKGNNEKCTEKITTKILGELFGNTPIYHYMTVDKRFKSNER